MIVPATGGRYRAAPPGDTLSFVPADGDTQFEALGTLNHTGSTTSSADPDACADGTASCVVVYNTGFSGTDLWAGDNAATLTSLAAGPPSLVGFDNSRFSSGQPAFPAQSPGQRFYITDTPVTYLCDTGQGTVRRYWGYSRRASQTDVDSHAELVGLPNPAEDALVARDVSACQFQNWPIPRPRHRQTTHRYCDQSNRLGASKYPLLPPRLVGRNPF